MASFKTPSSVTPKQVAPKQVAGSVAPRREFEEPKTTEVEMVGQMSEIIIFLKNCILKCLEFATYT